MKLLVRAMKLLVRELLTMSKPKEPVRPIASSQQSEDNYNLEAKKRKMKDMGASLLIMKMYE